MKRIPSTMRNILTMLIIVSTTTAQFQIEWQIDQYDLEYGHSYFDINEDTIHELTKQYLNTVTLYDGGNNWSVAWAVEDQDHEYFTLIQVMELVNGESAQGIFLAENYYNSLSFNVQALPIGSSLSNWQSMEFAGYVAGMDIADMDADGVQEIILGVSDYDSDLDEYFSYVVVMNSASGGIEWISELISGYLYGVYAGDPDNNGIQEIVFNRYDLTNELYTLHSVSPVGSGCLEGDITGDGSTNVLDVVSLVSCVLNSCDAILSPCIDLNQDGQLDVLDIVSTVQLIISIPPEFLMDYQEEWSVTQDVWEYGHILFDVNQDGVPDLTKEWGNSISVYDGSQAWDAIWYLYDAETDVLTLEDLTDVDGDDIYEAIIAGAILDTPSFNLQIFETGASDAIWVSTNYDGELSWVDISDLDEDGISEIVAGQNISDDLTGDSCSFFILNGLTGETIWQSEVFTGLMIGPYVENIDTDSQPEIVINICNSIDESYFLAVYSYSVSGELQQIHRMEESIFPKTPIDISHPVSGFKQWHGHSVQSIIRAPLR